MHWLKFFPAVAMFICWIHVVDTQWEIKQVAHLPIQSQLFTHTIGQAMDNPWNQVTAFSIYFQKLAQSEVSPQTWAASTPYARAYWHVFQAQPALLPLIASLHYSNDNLAESRYVKKFMNAYPLDSNSELLRPHLQPGHNHPRDITWNEPH